MDFADLAKLEEAKAAENEGHMKRHGPDPNLQERAARYRAEAARYRQDVLIVRRTVNLMRPIRAELVPLAARSAARPRGAGRPAQRRAGGARSSQDPGESDPEPKRLCDYCGRELPPDRLKYCRDSHAAADRQRRKRHRDRERDRGPKVSSFRHERGMFHLTDEELALLRYRALCHCNGSHIADGDQCIKCGRARARSPLGRRILLQLAEEDQ